MRHGFPAGTRIGKSITRAVCIGVRLKGIKQDPRLERPEVQGNKDWIYLGDVADERLSIVFWVQKLFRLWGRSFGGPRDPKAPCFVHRDLRQAHTYPSMIKDYRALWSRAPSCEDASEYASHSLRVAGFSTSRRSEMLQE